MTTARAKRVRLGICILPLQALGLGPPQQLGQGTKLPRKNGQGARLDHYPKSREPCQYYAVPSSMRDPGYVMSAFGFDRRDCKEQQLPGTCFEGLQPLHAGLSPCAPQLRECTSMAQAGQTSACTAKRNLQVEASSFVFVAQLMLRCT